MKIYFLEGAVEREFTGINRYIRPFVETAAKREKNIVFSKTVPLPILEMAQKAGLIAPSLFKEFFTAVKPEPTDDCILYISNQALASCLLWKKYKRVIVVVHDVAPLTEYGLFGALKFGFLDKAVTAAGIKAAKRANIIIAVSQFTKKEIMKYLRCADEKVVVVYPGVGREFAYRPVGKSGTDILYVGSEEPRKNVELLIKAFAKMKRRKKDLRLIKIGKSRWEPGRARIKSLIESLGLTDSVIFREYVDDLAGAYNAADVFVFPSLYEGFGSPVVEAMSCGLPVVCSNAASLPELVGDAAVMFDPHNEDELAHKVLEVLGSPEKQKQMREKGLERARLFSWDKHIDAVFSLCGELSG